MSLKRNESGVDTGNLDYLQTLRFNLSQAVSWLNNSTRQLLKPYGITPKQYYVLQRLATEPDETMTIQALRGGMADQMSDTSRLVDRLLRKKYLQKTPSEVDRRSSLIRISPSGLKLVQTVARSQEAFDRIISDRLSKAETKQLNQLLERLK